MVCCRARRPGTRDAEPGDPHRAVRELGGAGGARPILVGGESVAALQRAARRGDGWIGMAHTPATAAAQVRRLRRLCAEAGRDPAEVEVSVAAAPADAAALDAYAAAGVDRLIVSPWDRTADAVEGLHAYTRDVLGKAIR
jgi:alkanesulfonate monooxygenase SsuD/methylene tetrahydromethanopterin reductase-like flavin-dependent oxidoreductase (luciferase family)